MKKMQRLKIIIAHACASSASFLIFAGFAQECTPAGWCLVSDEEQMQWMYKADRRVGSNVYGTVLVRDCPGCGFRAQYPLRVNCKDWSYEYVGVSPLTPIAPNSPAHLMAKDLCRR